MEPETRLTTAIPNKRRRYWNLTAGVVAAVGLLITCGSAMVTAVAKTAQTDGVIRTESPFYCNIDALTPTERSEYAALTTRIGPAVAKTAEIKNGYVITLDRTRVALLDVARWIDFERRCCPFFDFALSLARNEGPMRLTLTGPHGVNDFIRAEFGLGR
jgi:hypothetical protein